ncbi:tetratricopeptide repeat protein [Halopseudomonas xiamenensis]|uniref:tetratricopeptide repeat protein n=1 Tax=Halopseudomonas xiamenensis TaxID=157792 RepID=UPI0016277A05|nr:tetratricopeptide repeat protein [Halopseudomonas xiamenensis]
MRKAISLDAAIIVTDISKRTFWRRLNEGRIRRQVNDARGRAMLAFADLIPLLCVAVDPEDYEIFTEADAGDADAQNDLAQLFLEANRPDIAVHWLQLAVDQEHADAMHNLAKLYIKGTGVQKDENTGLMWLTKAAAFGHPIAGQQLLALTQAAKL